MALQAKRPSRRNLRGELSIKSILRIFEHWCHGAQCCCAPRPVLISVASFRCAILGLGLRALRQISPGLALARIAWCCREICLCTRASPIQLRSPAARSSQNLFGTFRRSGSLSRSFCQSLHGLGEWLWA